MKKLLIALTMTASMGISAAELKSAQECEAGVGVYNMMQTAHSITEDQLAYKLQQFDIIDERFSRYTESDDDYTEVQAYYNVKVDEVNQMIIKEQKEFHKLNMVYDAIAAHCYEYYNFE